MLPEAWYIASYFEFNLKITVHPYTVHLQTEPAQANAKHTYIPRAYSWRFVFIARDGGISLTDIGIRHVSPICLIDDRLM